MSASPHRPSVSSRRSRGLSFRSERSQRSTGSNRTSLQETPEEKARRTLHTKADPTVAISELQPMAVAMEKSNLGSLRAIQHKDQYGNPITEPDLSNPTRPRFERPLETIQAFERAIYTTYLNNTTRPQSFIRTDDGSRAGDYSRRGSYYGDSNSTNPYSRRHADQGAYYGARSSQPDSFFENYTSPNQLSENYYPYNQGSIRSRPRPSQRMNTDPGMNVANTGQQAGYRQNGYSRPYDRVNASDSGDHHIDPWGNSADPSSLNGVQGQFQQQQRHGDKLAENYGFQGFGAGPKLNEVSPNIGGNSNDWSFNSGAPRDDWKKPQQGPVPLNGDTSTGGADKEPSAPPAPPPHRRRQLSKTPSESQSNEKRKSWFMRRFSKDR